MKYLDEFRDSEMAARLVERIRRRPPIPVNFMEVCGTHTVSIFRHGIRQLLPENVNLISGPGCPVCVTANGDIDWAIAAAKHPDTILTTFGDMLKVPGSYSSLQQVRAEGGDVRVVYSTLDALQIARSNPSKKVVFFGIGFETTAPTIACSVLEAEEAEINNYFVFSVHKVMPPPMKALVDSGEVRIDGFLCPGHVSTIIGSEPYRFLAEDYGVPCVIAGFEPLDVLQSIDMLLAQRVEGRAEVEIQYSRVVRPKGNPAALEALYRVFQPTDAEWRGLGTIPDSGLKVREEYARFDARRALQIDPGPTREHRACRCGEVLRGIIKPPECPLYGRACTPETPVGPCMVSSEGTCSTWFQFAGVE
ncbi:MAG TPA: hydrogenase formation protein HypD [Chloroflexota bacterium]|nr:hydrogenase formation protein HypD [Chloroflexota bacterium]